jgi:gamma-glutamylcyclotransferase (GGCT)/AIG2-like uncharacterized protein YtfP
MQQTSRHLFVYGTLMRAAGGALGKAERGRLLRESRHLGVAAMHGAELFDLGHYPGLSDSGERGNVVHGEVIELFDAARTFVWLDDYEGLGPQAEYVRELRRVLVVGERELDAWVYLLRRAGDPGKRIRSGRWVSQT